MVKVKDDYIIYLEFPNELYDLGSNDELEIVMKDDKVKYKVRKDSIIQVDDESILFRHYFTDEVMDLDFDDILNIICIRNYDSFDWKSFLEEAVCVLFCVAIIILAVSFMVGVLYG